MFEWKQNGETRKFRSSGKGEMSNWARWDSLRMTEEEGATELHLDVITGSQKLPGTTKLLGKEFQYASSLMLPLARKQISLANFSAVPASTIIHHVQLNRLLS